MAVSKRKQRIFGWLRELALWVVLVVATTALWRWSRSARDAVLPTAAEAGPGSWSMGALLLTGLGALVAAVILVPTVALLAMLLLRRALRLQFDRGRFDRALRHAVRGHSLARRCFGRRSRTAAGWLTVIAAAHSRQGDFESAIAVLREAVEIQESLLPCDGAREELAKCLTTLGAALRNGGESSAAKPVLERAVELFETGNEPASLDLVRALEELSELRLAEHDFGGAEALARRAFATGTDLFPERDLRLEPRRAQLAETLRRAGHWQESVALSRKALGIVEANTDEDDPTRCAYLVVLGRGLEERGAVEEAEALYRRALALAERGSEERERSAGHLARLLEEQGRVEDLGIASPLGVAMQRASFYESRGELEAASMVLEGAIAQAPTSPEKASALGHLAQVLGALGRPDEADRRFQEALSMPEASSNPELCMSLENNRAFALQNAGHLEEARRAYEEVLSFIEAKGGAARCECAIGYNNLAEIFREQERFGEAAEAYEKALVILEAAVPEHDERRLALLENMAGCYDESGDEEALARVERKLARSRRARELS